MVSIIPISQYQHSIPNWWITVYRSKGYGSFRYGWNFQAVSEKDWYLLESTIQILGDRGTPSCWQSLWWLASSRVMSFTSRPRSTKNGPRSAERFAPPLSTSWAFPCRRLSRIAMASSLLLLMTQAIPTLSPHSSRYSEPLKRSPTTFNAGYLDFQLSTITSDFPSNGLWWQLSRLPGHFNHFWTFTGPPLQEGVCPDLDLRQISRRRRKTWNWWPGLRSIPRARSRWPTTTTPIRRELSPWEEHAGASWTPMAWTPHIRWFFFEIPSDKWMNIRIISRWFLMIYLLNMLIFQFATLLNYQRTL